jgi:hypothetical protein
VTFLHFNSDKSKTLRFDELKACFRFARALSFEFSRAFCCRLPVRACLTHAAAQRS